MVDKPGDRERRLANLDRLILRCANSSKRLAPERLLRSDPALWAEQRLGYHNAPFHLECCAEGCTEEPLGEAVSADRDIRLLCKDGDESPPRDARSGRGRPRMPPL